MFYSIFIIFSLYKVSKLNNGKVQSFMEALVKHFITELIHSLEEELHKIKIFF
jgi:hypothetical protein